MLLWGEGTGTLRLRLALLTDTRLHALASLRLLRAGGERGVTEDGTTDHLRISREHTHTHKGEESRQYTVTHCHTNVGAGTDVRAWEGGGEEEGKSS